MRYQRENQCKHLWVLAFLGINYAVPCTVFSLRHRTATFLPPQPIGSLSYLSAHRRIATICHAKLSKLASNFDLDEILSNEKQFTLNEEEIESKKSRRRTSSKDKKKQKLKEVLEKQKAEKRTMNEVQATGIDTEENSDSDFEHETLLNSIEFEVHEVDSSEAGNRVDGLLVQLLNPDSTEVAISRSQCGTLLSSGSVFVVPQEKVSEFQSAWKGEEAKYSQFQAVGAPIDKKSYQLEQSTLILYPSRRSLQTSPLLLNNMVPTEIIPQNLPLNILYEDEYMVVINKEAGMVVHPAAGNWDGTVVNALAYYLLNESPFGGGDFFGLDGDHADTFSGVDYEMEEDNEDFEDDLDTSTEGEINQNDAVTNSISTLRPGIVHRLDKGTTGVLVVAKTRAALASLSEAFAQRRVKKQYLAIAVGNPGEDIRINKPIGRHPVHRQKMRVVPDPSASAQMRLTGPKSSLSKQGRVAISYLRTLSHDGKLSLVQVQIATGRTHQIRVHLHDHGTPIYGDDVYGLNNWNKALSATRGITRPLLHAQRLEIEHPVSGKRMTFEAEVADDMMGVIKAIVTHGTDVETLLQGK